MINSVIRIFAIPDVIPVVEKDETAGQNHRIDFLTNMIDWFI
jgi:hypothetical protein